MVTELLLGGTLVLAPRKKKKNRATATRAAMIMPINMPLAPLPASVTMVVSRGRRSTLTIVSRVSLI